MRFCASCLLSLSFMVVSNGVIFSDNLHFSLNTEIRDYTHTTCRMIIDDDQTRFFFLLQEASVKAGGLFTPLFACGTLAPTGLLKIASQPLANSPGSDRWFEPTKFVLATSRETTDQIVFIVHPIPQTLSLFMSLMHATDFWGGMITRVAFSQALMADALLALGVRQPEAINDEWFFEGKNMPGGFWTTVATRIILKVNPLKLSFSLGGSWGDLFLPGMYGAGTACFADGPVSFVLSASVQSENFISIKGERAERYLVIVGEYHQTLLPGWEIQCAFLRDFLHGFILDFVHGPGQLKFDADIRWFWYKKPELSLETRLWGKTSSVVNAEQLRTSEYAIGLDNKLVIFEEHSLALNYFFKLTTANDEHYFELQHENRMGLVTLKGKTGLSVQNHNLSLVSRLLLCIGDEITSFYLEAESRNPLDLQNMVQDLSVPFTELVRFTIGCRINY